MEAGSSRRDSWLGARRSWELQEGFLAGSSRRDSYGFYLILNKKSLRNGGRELQEGFLLVLSDFAKKINEKWRMGAPGGIPIDFKLILNKKSIRNVGWELQELFETESVFEKSKSAKSTTNKTCVVCYSKRTVYIS